MSDYYDHGSAPADNSFGDPAVIRAEFDLITQNISGKLPPLAGNGDKILAVNAGATALVSLTTTGTGNAVRATSPTLTTPKIGAASFTSAGAYAVTFTFSGDTNVTFPTSGTLAKAGANGDITSLTALVNQKFLAQVPVTTQTGVVATGTTVVPADNTIPQITEGDQYMTLAITPKNAASTLVIEVVAFASNNAAATNLLTAALFQDATANALALSSQSAAQSTMQNFKFTHVMTAGTTSATTFRLRIGGGAAGTTTFNGVGGTQFFGGVLASRITITEYLP